MVTGQTAALLFCFVVLVLMLSVGTKIQGIRLDNGTICWHHLVMKRKHRKTLELIFRKPVSGNVKWQEVVAMLNAYGATIDENRAGSRVHIELQNKDLLQHKPHPSPSMDKGAVTALRKFLELCDIRP